jgi:hypothetical protein
MSDQEKRAWIELSIILGTLAVYFAFIAFGRLDPVSLAVFALAGFLGFRRKRPRAGVVTYDERDGRIERHALLTSLIVFYLLAIAFTVAAGVAGYGDRSVPIWVVIQIFWAASLVVWAVKAIIIIVSYRRSVNA